MEIGAIEARETMVRRMPRLHREVKVDKEHDLGGIAQQVAPAC